MAACRSSARSIGRAKASPTMDTVEGRCRATAVNSSSASKCGEVREMTVPPSVSTGSDAMISPVLCIIGEAGSATGGGYDPRS